MFNAYDFTYAGISASEFGLYVCDVGSKNHSDNSFGTQANIIETRIANRVSPLHYGVRWNDSPLSFSLVFASDEPMDRYDLQRVSMWLMGHQQYQWLTIHQDDLSHVHFRCIIQKLTPVTIGWAPVAFEASVVCDCPYGYSDQFESSYDVSGETTVTFRNLSTCREMLRPEMQIEINSGTGTFSMENTTTGETAFVLDNLPGGALSVYVDNENCVLKEDVQGYDLYDYFNFGFLGFAPGDNELKITGNGTVTIRGRYLYNTGA